MDAAAPDESRGRPAAPARTARQRAREEITGEILRAARVRLRSDGPAQLSLRAVARDVGMVSSAVYRYFASRDLLLTALLVQVYDELGQAAESADAAVADRAQGRARLQALCHTVRDWALEHPGEYALLYGSPVPGYAAPQETINPASRVILVLASIAAATRAAEGDAEPEPKPELGGAPGGASAVLAPAMAFAAEHGVAVGRLDGDAALRVFAAWTTLFGTLSFELFGHFVGAVTDNRAYFELVVGRLADDLGL